jgi:hypothetical protein
MLLFEYNQSKDRLLEDLKNAASPQASIGIIHDYLATLADPKGSAVKSFPSPRQAEVALSILGIYKDHFRKLLDIFERLPVRPAAAPAQPESPAFSENETLYGVGAAALIGGFLANPLLGIPLALAGGVVASKWARGREEAAQASEVRQVPPPRLDFTSFMAELEELFKAIDDVVESLGQVQGAARPAQAGDSARLLAFTQEVLGWHWQNKGLLPEPSRQALDGLLAERLGDIFAGQNIEVRYYDAGRDGRDPALFDFEVGAGESALAEPLTIRPALLQDGGVLLRGRVLEPRLPGGDPSSPLGDKPKSRSRKSK